MKGFILKVLYFLFPLIGIGVSMEALIRNIPNDYSYKKQFLDKNANRIEILFLGSSHTFYGINPEFISPNSFNASHISQSVDYDYEILSKYKNDWSKLKYIVIPVDYFTLFSRLSSGQESWRVKNYEIYYGIDKSNLVANHSELLSIKTAPNLKRIYSYYFQNVSAITCSDLGYGKIDLPPKDLEKTGIEAAKRHSKADKKYLEENIRLLKELVDFAAKRNIKVLLYTNPAFHTYVSRLSPNQLEVTYKTVNSLVSNYSNCSYHDFLNDQSFGAGDFTDADHLNSLGAKKLSMKLGNILMGM